MVEEFEGRVIITWPEPVNGAIHSASIAIADADTGEPIVSAMAVTVYATLDGPIVAEMTMLTGEDGKPLPAGAPVVTAEDGSFRQGTFRCLVAEMRTAEEA